MELDRRAFLAAVAAAAVSSKAASAAVAFTPEQFGAKGNGVTNDTAAFGRLSDAVNRAGGGVIALRSGATYLVGSQRVSDGRSWSFDPILELEGLSKPLTIVGNGARLRAAPGLRFGTFDVATGLPTGHPMPFFDRDQRAAPYRAMIWIHDCSASVTVRDVELDGNSATLKVGGGFGDKGWQVPATGLLLMNNRADETVTNVFSHHHGLDGAMFVGTASRKGATSVTRLLSRYNGRQGLSITGGRAYRLADCEFSHTGKLAIKSAPGAGVDIEAEHPPIRDLSFTRCSFIDNRGCGMVADSGDSAGARFEDCRFIGTTSWAAWPKKPGFVFNNCLFVGSVVHAFADAADASRATQFVGCTFTDDPKLSPTGEVFVGGGPIVNANRGDNVLFDRCTFRLVGNGMLPRSANAIYRDCRMRQASARPASTRGRFVGRTTIDGAVNVRGSQIVGTLIVNGQVVKDAP